MKVWINVVGIGEAGLNALGEQERELIAQAQVLIGGARHLAMVPENKCEKLPWPSPFRVLVDEIRDRQRQCICILATGDPFCYGVGTTLSRHFGPDEMRVWPTTSAFTLARARLGWPIHGVTPLTLHGRSLALLTSMIQPERKLLILSEDASTPGKIAERLSAQGFEKSVITVLENLGGSRERIRSALADAFALPDIDSLNTVAVQCRVGNNPCIRSTAPGLPDHAFQHDGQLTKRVVRAATLSSLVPLPGQRLWDIGAGCGSVSIEWMRAALGTQAIAVERNSQRLEFISVNAEALGVPGLTIVPGEAPSVCAKFDPPDAIFIGGGVGQPGLFEHCWSRLNPGGRLVANAVSVQSRAILYKHYCAHGGELLELTTARAQPTGQLTTFHPMYTVTQLTLTKTL